MKTSHIRLCVACNDYGVPAKKRPGSDGLAIAAWMLFPMGLPYTLWRQFCKIPVCKQCGSEHLVREDSAIGAKIMARIIGESDNGNIVDNDSNDELPIAPPQPDNIAPVELCQNSPRVLHNNTPPDPDAW